MSHRLARTALGALSILAACSFPDYGFNPEPAPAAGSGGSAAQSGSSGSGGMGGAGTNAAEAGAGAALAGGADGASGAAAAGGASGAAGAGGQVSAAGPHCRALLEGDSSLASGAYLIDPDADGPLAAFEAHCDMQDYGGGWTLIGSFLNSTFNATAMGSASEHCYDAPCVNRAYATLPLENDLRIDAADVAIAGGAVDSTAIFTGIPASSAGRTLRAIFTAGVPAYVESATTTLSVDWFNGLGCGSWANYGAGLCQADIHVVFAIASGCPDGPVFAFGVANNFDGTGSFCDGWPQLPGTNFPKAIRIWTR